MASSSSVRLRARSAASSGFPAHDQTFARIVRALDLGQVAVVEQVGLQGAALGGKRLDGGRAQGGDPVEASRFQLLLDARRGDHAAVTHEDHALQAEALLQLGDLGGQRRRVGGVAREHLDRDRAAVGGTQQADHDLRFVAPAIPAVAEPRQLAAAALQIGRGDVVEHQRAVGEMPPGQRPLDRRLRLAEPVERAVHLLGRHSLEAQHGAERVARRGRVEGTGGGQLGRRLEHPRHDQRQGQLAPALAAARQQPVQSDPPRRAERREHMAVGQRAQDLQPLTRRHQRIPTQHCAQQRDPLSRPVGQILQGPVPDLAAITPALPQQNGGPRATVGDDSDVHASFLA